MILPAPFTPRKREREREKQRQREREKERAKDVRGEEGGTFEGINLA